MSTAPTPPNPPVPPAPQTATAPPTGDKPIDMRNHSPMIYFWPVWLLGFIFAGLTYIEGTRFIHVPNHADIDVRDQDGATPEIRISPKEGELKAFAKKMRQEKERDAGHLPRMSHHHYLGSTFVIVLLLVILSSMMTFRGLWSWIVIITVALVAFIVYLLGWLESIFAAVGNLHIYIGFAGYLFFSTVLFIIWCISTFIFDMLTYAKFRAGQMEVCEAIGEGSKLYDMSGMQIEKLQTDVFRHKILGLGWLG